MLLFVLPFAIGNMKSAFNGTNWTLAIMAGILGATGTLLFNGMLSEAPLKKIGLLIVIMVIVETVVPAAYQAFNNGVTVKQGIGFVLAGISAVLLIL